MFTNLFSGLAPNVFDEFRRLETDMDQIFGRGAWPAGIRAVRRGTFPPINVGATPERVGVYVFAGGAAPKTLDISMQQNLLIVAGSRKLEVDEAADYYRRERFEGELRRVIPLPEHVDPERVGATYRDGVLQITVQRREAARPRQITVN